MAIHQTSSRRLQMLEVAERYRTVDSGLGERSINISMHEEHVVLGLLGSDTVLRMLVNPGLLKGAAKGSYISSLSNVENLVVCAMALLIESFTTHHPVHVALADEFIVNLCAFC
ncbi:hypothetical protein AC579_351 [Pseudocercospora musae]|uniref:Uncharacterized protein n=1 Tax=Pseudocercospora musae TaxID=113226 RepID=A0A139IQU3_9PEZI|nr:hypothetical protein AC579_351 [Pseudocercospora musae]